MGALNGSRRDPPREGTFRPWREDFVAAALLAAMAAFALWRGLSAGRLPPLLFALALATVLGAGARWAFRSGRRRWHGKSLEKDAVAQIGRLLDARQVSWHAGVRARALGDADLLVQTPHGWAVVEIKSYRSWSGARRDRDAIAQVKALQVDVNAISPR